MYILPAYVYQLDLSYLGLLVSHAKTQIKGGYRG